MKSKPSPHSKKAHQPASQTMAATAAPKGMKKKSPLQRYMASQKTQHSREGGFGNYRGMKKRTAY